MTKFQEAIATYKSFMTEKLEMKNVNENVLVSLAQMLGNNIFDADASLVACSDKAELSRVKELFLINELGLTENPKLDEAIKTVCKQMGTSNRKKFRVVFYYLLLQNFGLDSNYTTGIKATKTEKAPAAAKATKITKTATPVEVKVTKATKAIKVEAPVEAKTTKVVKTTTPVEVKAAKVIKATKPAEVTVTKSEKTIEPTFSKSTTTTTFSKSEAKATVTKSATKTKIVAAPVFNTFDETYDFYTSYLYNEIGFFDVQPDLLSNLINTAGENSVVDVKTETATIKNNFLIGRLGCEESNELNNAINTVNERMGQTPKYRAIFYYLLTVHLGKEWVITQPAVANLY
jgi:Protein of unknown function (DUF2853)